MGYQKNMNEMGVTFLTSTRFPCNDAAVSLIQALELHHRNNFFSPGFGGNM